MIPDLIKIQRARTTNGVYSNNGILVTLSTELNILKDTFEISLNAERKRDGLSIRLETRIAIEQHTEGNGHIYPHLQIDNFNQGEAILKSGKLHVTLLVKNKEQLEQCCNGFVFSISEILQYIEGILEIKIELKRYFFNETPLKEMKKDKIVLEEVIFNSFKQNQVLLDNKKIKLVEFKGSKREEVDTNNSFELLKILLLMKVAHPILINPLVKLLLEDPKIKSVCPNLTIEECRLQLEKKDKLELMFYNKKSFIKEFKE